MFRRIVNVKGPDRHVGVGPVAACVKGNRVHRHLRITRPSWISVETSISTEKMRQFACKIASNPTEDIWQRIKNALTPPAVARREKEVITAAPIAKAPARHPRLPASAAILAAPVRSSALAYRA